ncbi:MAG: hypothetical protein V4597_15460 [Pseudomonadota bacterium]
MQRFSIIGAAHVQNAALFEALEKALDEAAPDQLILEMPDDAVTMGDVAHQKPEMLVAYRWAARRGVPVRGHEPSGPSILRDGLTAERIGALVQEMDTLVSNLTVRRTIDIFCDRGEPETPAEQRLEAVIKDLIDPEKALARTQAMIAAIRHVAIPEGAVLIVCGGVHAPHIAAALPGCRIIHGEHFF